MKAFIGTKIILAEEMSDIDFGRKYRHTTPEENQPGLMGYHVQYPQLDGSKYNSWSPRYAFEHAYREFLNKKKKLFLEI